MKLFQSCLHIIYHPDDDVNTGELLSALSRQKGNPAIGKMQFYALTKDKKELILALKKVTAKDSIADFFLVLLSPSLLNNLIRFASLKKKLNAFRSKGIAITTAVHIEECDWKNKFDGQWIWLHSKDFTLTGKDPTYSKKIVLKQLQIIGKCLEKMNDSRIKKVLKNNHKPVKKSIMDILNEAMKGIKKNKGSSTRGGHIWSSKDSAELPDDIWTKEDTFELPDDIWIKSDPPTITLPDKMENEEPDDKFDFENDKKEETAPAIDEETDSEEAAPDETPATTDDGETGLESANGNHTNKPQPALSTHIVEETKHDQEPEGDKVTCSAFAPPSVTKETPFKIQVHVHLPEAEKEVENMAAMLDEHTRKQAKKSLREYVKTGDELGFELKIPGLKIDDNFQTLEWFGESDFVEFNPDRSQRQPPQ